MDYCESIIPFQPEANIEDSETESGVLLVASMSNLH